VFALSNAAPTACAQNQVADLREDVSGLTQHVNELSLRVEQLERQNQELQAKVGTLSTGRDTVTEEQLNRAVADLNSSIKSAVATSRSEILEQVATQMERLAKQTNAALDSISRSSPAPSAEPRPLDTSAPSPLKAGAAPTVAREGTSYTVVRGDTLGLIAKKTGSKVQDIIEANKLTDPSRIQAGQVLIIPGGK
jgi:LysM repeat protein